VTAGLLFWVLHLIAQAEAGPKFDYDKIKDFTKSPTEHIIIELDHPIEVRSVRGLVRDQTGFLRQSVIFEIREKSSDAVRRATTDARGRFRIKGVQPGEYDFKATLDGFQSVVGVIILSRKADPKNAIQIQLKVGV